MTVFYRTAMSLFLGIAVLLFSGCNKSGSSSSGGGDVASIAEAAMTALDKDSDGILSKKELAAAPGLLSHLSEYDTSGDNAIDQEELAGNFKRILTNGDSASCSCTVTYKGRPLSGATVKFVPEAFLGDSVKTAEGTTDQDGKATMATTGEAAEGDAVTIQTGFYKVVITHPSVKIPAKYNKKTTLGLEFFPFSRDKNPEFKLK